MPSEKAVEGEWMPCTAILKHSGKVLGSSLDAPDTSRCDAMTMTIGGFPRSTNRTTSRWRRKASGVPPVGTQNHLARDFTASAPTLNG